ncbi:tRNA (guanosine(37)-N1)-methyltransferase TrmD [Carboxylicivirga taeanensis]|uniref:tRNA (guanosine(37)-N1)-methyltransferase TrmD n=1 Tax=Carboxylicivirga taeanensis TaxID=1416875 RepID=UPI003F6DFEEC
MHRVLPTYFYLCEKSEFIMRIDILTLFPEMFEGPLTQSIMKRAVDKGLVEMHFHDIRDYTMDKHKKVDDYAFGGGAGMVMTIQPIADLIDKLKAERAYEHVIYMTPDGQRFEQRIANTLSLCGNIMILCGHYKGVDQRIRDHYVTMELSIGDYVLTGGELAAAVVSDAIIRLIPGVMSDETSALTDSFQDGLLSPPVYTRPADYNGWKVPEVLLSGNQAKIDEWREQQAYERTKQIRPDLLEE